ncbi:MAG: hypothetical protein F6K54_01550 [Okeania sp. SIO3B5]|uniref:hypothetical protein n=1 Tax=Okeania sp. SIO3B5 TaxID=2607811 RepID=UPI0014001BC8|nr:hypothetical protein [Okeania sp. SIO3B5]NEO51887.1 hypothetical protein [Okeania sp. SIO3B5]
MENKSIYTVNDRGTIELFGPLMLWDERIELFLEKCYGWHPEVNIESALGLTPNIYAVHSAKYKGTHFDMMSFTDFQITTGTNASAIVGLASPNEAIPPEEIKGRFNKAIVRYVDTEIVSVVKEIIAVHSGEKKKTPYSSSYTTIQTLMLLYEGKFEE